MRAPFFVSLSALCVVACSSASFDVGPNGDDTGTNGGDSAVVDDGVSNDTGTPPLDSGGEGSGDAISGDVIGSCTLPSPTTAPDLFVDAAASGPSVGTAACPFRHILQATTIDWTGSGVRTIHVVGGEYDETAAVVVRTGVVLEGAGPASTTIKGPGGACASMTCLVELSAGSVLHGFTVVASGTNGIVTDGGAPAARLFDLVVKGATGGNNAGILTRNDADIGPAVLSTANARGLDVAGPGTVTVRAPTGLADLNVFESSEQSGIYIEGAAQLVFGGGEVRHNGANGIFANNGSPTPHAIANASIHGNAASGLFVSENASAVVRGSAFLGNAVGVRFMKGATNSLDLGNDSAPGNNSFGGAGIPTKPSNRFTQICVDGGSATLPFEVSARGDSWPSCAPSTGTAGSCDPVYMTTFIADVTYAKLSSSPVSTDPCVVTTP